MYEVVTKSKKKVSICSVKFFITSPPFPPSPELPLPPSLYLTYDESVLLSLHCLSGSTREGEHPVLPSTFPVPHSHPPPSLFLTSDKPILLSLYCLIGHQHFLEGEHPTLHVCVWFCREQIGWFVLHLELKRMFPTLRTLKTTTMLPRLPRFVLWKRQQYCQAYHASLQYRQWLRSIDVDT